MIVSILLATVLSAQALPASGSKAPAIVAESGDICITTIRLWSGTSDDVRNIGVIPVPDSYRRQFTIGGCNSLDRGSLIDWNLSFGTEATTTKALAFLEHAYMADSILPDRFAGSLAKAWKLASPDLPAELALEELRGLEYEKAEGRLEGRPDIISLRHHIEIQQRYVLLAMQYLGAAEFYGSQMLLDKATIYAAAAEEGADFLSGTGSAAWLDVASDQIDDIRMRRTVLASRIDPRTPNIERAQAVMKRYDRPILNAIGERALQSRDPICGSRNLEESSDEIAQACEGEDNVDRRARVYWRNRAHLAISEAAEKGCAATSFLDFTLQKAVKLIENGRADNYGATGWPNYDDQELFALYMDMANLHFRWGAAGTTASCNADGALESAWHESQMALTFAPASRTPSRFQRAARLSLATAAAMHGKKHGMMDSAHDREAVFLRTTLQNLDRIAQAEWGNAN